jgi:hypothetical protein
LSEENETMKTKTLIVRTSYAGCECWGKKEEKELERIIKSLINPVKTGWLGDKGFALFVSVIDVDKFLRECSKVHIGVERDYE